MLFAFRGAAHFGGLGLENRAFGTPQGYPRVHSLTTMNEAAATLRYRQARADPRKGKIHETEFSSGGSGRRG